MVETNTDPARDQFYATGLIFESLILDHKRRIHELWEACWISSIAAASLSVLAVRMNE